MVIRRSTRSSKKKGKKGDKGTKSRRLKKNFDVSGYLEKIQEVEEAVERTDEVKKAMKSLDITTEHFNKCERTVKWFLEGIGSVCKCIFILTKLYNS